MKLTQFLRFVLGAALVALLLNGCASGPEMRAFAVQVTLDGPLAGTSVQVDMIAVNESTELPKWQGYNLTDYWQPNDSFRRDAVKFTLLFNRDKPNRQVMLSTDEHWAGWLRSGATKLVIVADLPGVAIDQTVGSDPRRLILPLDRAAWASGNKTLDILVQENGLKLLTPRQP